MVHSPITSHAGTASPSRPRAPVPLLEAWAGRSTQKPHSSRLQDGSCGGSKASAVPPVIRLWIELTSLPLTEDRSCQSARFIRRRGRREPPSQGNRAGAWSTRPASTLASRRIGSPTWPVFSSAGIWFRGACAWHRHGSGGGQKSRPPRARNRAKATLPVLCC